VDLLVYSGGDFTSLSPPPQLVANTLPLAAGKIKGVQTSARQHNVPPNMLLEFGENPDSW